MNSLCGAISVYIWIDHYVQETDVRKADQMWSEQVQGKRSD